MKISRPSALSAARFPVIANFATEPLEIFVLSSLAFDNAFPELKKN